MSSKVQTQQLSAALFLGRKLQDCGDSGTAAMMLNPPWPSLAFAALLNAENALSNAGIKRY